MAPCCRDEIELTRMFTIFASRAKMLPIGLVNKKGERMNPLPLSFGDLSQSSPSGPPTRHGMVAAPAIHTLFARFMSTTRMVGSSSMRVSVFPEKLYWRR